LRRKALFFVTKETSEVIVDICEAFIQTIGYVAARLAEHAGRTHVTILDVLQVLDNWLAPSGGEGFRINQLMQYASIEELLPPRALEPFPKKRAFKREVQLEAGVVRPVMPWLGELASSGDQTINDANLLDLNALVWDRRLVEPLKTEGESDLAPTGPDAALEPMRDIKEASDITASGPSSNDKDRHSTPRSTGEDTNSVAGVDHKSARTKSMGQHIEPWMPPFPPLHTYMETPMYASTENESEIDKLRRLNEQRLQVEDALSRVRGTGYQAIENPYLQLPRVPGGLGGTEASGRATLPGANASLRRRQFPTREPLKSEMMTARIRPTNEEVSDKAERILAESGGLTGLGQLSSNHSN
jgi:hypothetical protein